MKTRHWYAVARNFFYSNPNKAAVDVTSVNTITSHEDVDYSADSDDVAGI